MEITDGQSWSNYIDRLSAYVIISGNPPSHVGSGSKQTHVVNSEPMGSNSKYCIISINKHCLSMKNKYVIQNHITFMQSLLDILKTQCVW